MLFHHQLVLNLEASLEHPCMPQENNPDAALSHKHANKAEAQRPAWRPAIQQQHDGLIRRTQQNHVTVIMAAMHAVTGRMQV